MNKKFLVATLASMILGVFAFGTDNKGVELSNKLFAAKKEAAAICAKVQKEINDTTKGMSGKERDEFFKDFKRELHSNMSTLSKDDYLVRKACNGNFTYENHGHHHNKKSKNKDNKK